MNPRSCLITGAHGYLGSALRAYLVDAGWHVMAATRRPRGKDEIAYTLGDESAPEALSQVRALVHCAYDFQPISWSEIHRINVLGTCRLIEQARWAGIGTIVTISSISAYPGCRSLYGRAKLLMEEATLAAGGIVLRPGLIHGGTNRGMFGRLAAQVAGKRPVPLLAGHPCTQHLIPMGDLASLIDAILSRRVSPKGPWTVAHPRPWPLRDLLQAMAGKRRVRFIPVPWQLVWLALRCAEAGGLRPAFKSDSLLSLVHQNPQPDFLPFLTSGQPIHDFPAPRGNSVA